MNNDVSNHLIFFLIILVNEDLFGMIQMKIMIILFNKKLFIEYLIPIIKLGYNNSIP